MGLAVPDKYETIQVRGPCVEHDPRTVLPTTPSDSAATCSTFLGFLLFLLAFVFLAIVLVSLLKDVREPVQQVRVLVVQPAVPGKMIPLHRLA